MNTAFLFGIWWKGSGNSVEGDTTLWMYLITLNFTLKNGLWKKDKKKKSRKERQEQKKKDHKNRIQQNGKLNPTISITSKNTYEHSKQKETEIIRTDNKARLKNTLSTKK